ncbi:hypothetical protein HDU67_009372 [Dinochytrium kinnereticum]|nr:hypothetical protein HDU67_009372 [Dinochytrium kinnereticum]
MRQRKSVPNEANRRVIYVPPKPQAFFDTLTVPLPNLQQGKLVQPWFGANRYEAVCLPVPNGGLPLPGSVTWTFKEGGAFEFSTIFRQLSERIDDPSTYHPSEEDFLPEYAAPPAGPPPQTLSSDYALAPPTGNPPPAIAPYEVSPAATHQESAAYEVAPPNASLMDEATPSGAGGEVLTPTALSGEK